MAFSRRLGIGVMLGVSWLVAVGCDDSDDKKAVNGSEAGEGGESPSGGKASGGSANTAGKAGAATAGTAGTGTTGTAGTAGTAGTGGTVAETAGAAGMGISGDAGNGQVGGAPGVAGAGGAATAGAGGVGDGGAGGAPPAGALSCVYSCGSDDDCLLPGNDTSNKCNPTTKLCEDPAATCETHQDCFAKLTPWFPGCTSNGDCFDSEACVNVKGTGYCATLPDAEFGCDPFLAGTFTLFEGGEVQVCGSADVRCIAGACTFGCDAAGCQSQDETCDVASGVCSCETGADCETGVCSGGHCTECATSDDCAATADDTGLDTCVDGKCGCSGTDTCVAGAFDNAPAVCK